VHLWCRRRSTTSHGPPPPTWEHGGELHRKSGKFADARAQCPDRRAYAHAAALYSGKIPAFTSIGFATMAIGNLQASPVDGFTGPDPAERRAFNRLFYRNRRPTWLGHWVSQFFCWWARIGLPPRSWVALGVRDRHSGRMRTDAVVLPTVAGQRYVVSMFGSISDWVQNLEAADGDAVISHRRSVRVRLVLVRPNERAPILREYVRVASSGRKHFPVPVGAPLNDFAAIAAQYPVYRIEVAAAA
jgi:hypothetical protein